MLTKNYSTIVLLMAANVLDGGKELKDVPAVFQDNINEVIQALNTVSKDTQSNQDLLAQATQAVDDAKEAK